MMYTVYTVELYHDIDLFEPGQAKVGTYEIEAKNKKEAKAKAIARFMEDMGYSMFSADIKKKED